MLNSAAQRFRGLAHARLGKVLLLLLLVAITTTVSATVYVFYYSGATANLQSPEVELFAGSDSTVCVSLNPCAHVSIASTHDAATISMSFFPAATGKSSPVPATYFTNITTVRNTGTGDHDIEGVKITNIANPSNSLGEITVYYCTVQTEFSGSGSPLTPDDCVGSFAFNSTASGSVSGTFPVSIAPSTTQYVEIVAFASSTATAGSAASFNLAIQWN